MKQPPAPTLAARVAAHIRAEIVARRLTPGDRLPGEVELARRLRVSRGIVREGRRHLVAAGLIEISNGRRAVVSKLGAGPLDGFIADAVATRQLAVNEIFELRRAIEIEVAALAARRRTDDDIAELARHLERMRATVGRTAYLRHDLAFHRALAAATQNPLFTLLIDSMREPLAASMRASHVRRRSAREFAQAHAVHEGIFDAVRGGDPDAAERAMRSHFADVAAALEH
jgi:DNA-binding FadR family transcriptional regulator